MKAADKAQQFPPYLLSRYAKMGNKTHEHNITVRLLQKFGTIQNLDDSELSYNFKLTSCSGNGVKVRLHEARE
jgi:hypothetical protein